ncbi:hypothetical protein ACKU27_12080 [Sphingobium yanoikuyae]|uniref:hypothetical protein n=1 Tax=Sphingobium yanoikuyae TaxID=13690 RepID=UPI003B917C02
MNEDDFHTLDRRKFALKEAAALTLDSERPADIVARAEAFDAFLRGEKKAD